MTARETSTSTIGYQGAHREGRLHSVPGRPIVLRTAFDVAAYVREARGRIPVGAASVALDGPAEREDLAFLWRLEAAALSEARALLASWTGNEARITAFVATWAYERFWLGRAVRELLVAGGRAEPEPLSRAGIGARARALYVERVLPLVAPLTNVVGEVATAGQMARLAAQERSFQAAYTALLPRLDGEARRVVGQVIAQREEIIRFFWLEALTRIERSPWEARTAAFALRSGFRPLRVTGIADPDERRALRSIFRTPDDRARLRAATEELRQIAAHRPPGYVGVGAHDEAGGRDGSVVSPVRPSPGLLARSERHGVRP